MTLASCTKKGPEAEPTEPFVAPACRELAAMAAGEWGKPAPTPIADEVLAKLNPSSCADALRGVEASLETDPVQASTLAVFGMLVVLEDAGVRDQVESLGEPPSPDPSVDAVDRGLPRSPGSTFYELMPILRVAESAIELNGEQVASTPEEFTKVMPARIATLRDEAAERGEEYSPRLLVHADAGATIDQVTAIMRAGRTAGVQEWAFAVRADDVVRQINVMASLEKPRERADTWPELEVTTDGLRWRGKPIADLSALAVAIKGDDGKQPTYRLRAAGEVTLQGVVAAMDAMRGETCRLDEAMAGEEIPADCHYWQPVLQIDPPARSGA